MGFQCAAPAANQNAIPVMIPVGTRQRQDTLGKGKLCSPVGETIYANVIWPGMKWKYATRPPWVDQRERPPPGDEPPVDVHTQ